MLELLESVKADLEKHLRQRDNVALAVCSDDAEALIVSKLLEGIDDASTSELFWICTNDFTDAASWTSAVVNTFAAQHAAVSLALKEQGKAPWPPLPDAALDESLAPAMRLREVMAFSRELLPTLDGGLSVWCLYPLVVHDWQGYAALLWELLQHQFPMPWFHHLRAYLRGHPTDGWVYAVATQMPRIAWYDPDLSQKAMQEATDAEAMNPALPMDRRLQNVFLSAQMDYAHQRFADAMRKYMTLLKYYLAKRNGTMAALVLNGMGEVHQRVGNLEQAGHCFENAVIPASEEANPPLPVLTNVSLNLANLRMAQARYAEAEVYYDLAQGYATLQRAADTRLRAIENLGVCQYMQGKFQHAAATWQAGARAAGELEMLPLRYSMLQRLHALCYEVGDTANCAVIERELAAVAATLSSPPA